MLRGLLTFVFVGLAAARLEGVKTVDLGYAVYKSDLSLESGVTSFLGVRYAAAPVGPLRFHAPTPLVVGSKTTQNATTPGKQCWQAPGLVGSPGAALRNPFRQGNSTDHAQAVGLRQQPEEWKRDDSDGISDEDCLFLNVHIPTKSKTKALLPVIVYLHGGGYDAGNISLYPTQDFVSLSGGGLVAVSVQYRLGVFGFLAGKDVKQDGAPNAGLLDQNFALQWVQKYISRFGGDPNKVTIWGQSAGAGSVLQHVVAHAGNTQPPLFRAALANSPFLPFQYRYDDPIPEALYAEVVSMCGCADAANTLDCLRAAPAPLLLAADTTLGVAGFMGTYTFVPVVDGTFIVERPSVTLNQRGRANGDALLVTTNSDEGAGFFVFPDVLATNNFTLREYITQLFARLPEASINTAVELYAGIGAGVGDQATKVMAESIFVCPAYWMVKPFRGTGWKGEFAIPPGLHAEDLSYEFSTFAIPPTYTNPAFLAAYRQSFLSVASNLSPNKAVHSNESSILPPWEGWASAHIEMLFNATESGEPIIETFRTDAQLLQRCAFWKEVSMHTAQ
ncbi:alpha/beta-hydrolase [Mycena filopes]|nr:alpha/beta-hydrolase [Mycena filopes]